MKPQETTENNRLIAEFMHDGDFTGIGFCTDSQTFKKLEYSDLKFHTSFDWLMPVVHKCLEICHKEMLNEWENAFSEAFLSCDIQVLYKEALDLIKWYNQQSK